MNTEQIGLINRLKDVLNKIDKDENTKEIAKDYIDNFHKWIVRD